jgi:tetratricopeptide (TPR) repeat protein
MSSTAKPLPRAPPLAAAHRVLVRPMKCNVSLTVAVVICAFCLCAFAPAMSARTDVASLIRDGCKASADNRNADAIALLSAAIVDGHKTRDSHIAAAITVAYCCRANAYERLYQWDKAIADYSEAIQRNPQSARIYAYRGYVYAEIRHFGKAYADYGAALRIDPKNKAVYALRGDTARLNGRWDAALRDAAEAISLDPKYGRAYQVRGRAYEGKKEYVKASNNFEQAIRLSPGYLDAYLARADTIYETGDFEHAAKAYRELLRRFPQSDRSHYAIAWFLATCPVDQLRNGMEAVAEGTKACEMVQWQDWSNMEALAAAYAEIGQFDRAITCLKRAINMRRPEATSENEMVLRRMSKLFDAHKPYREHPNES